MPIVSMALHAARAIRQRRASELVESDISPEQRRNLEMAFEAADKNVDGILSADEYYELFQIHGLTIGTYLISIKIALTRNFLNIIMCIYIHIYIYILHNNIFLKTRNG